MAGQQASTAASALSYKGASIKTNGGAGDGVVGAVAEGLHLAGLNRDRAGGTESRSRAQISHLQVARAKFVEAGKRCTPRSTQVEADDGGCVYCVRGTCTSSVGY